VYIIKIVLAFTRKGDDVDTGNYIFTWISI